MVRILIWHSKKSVDNNKSQEKGWVTLLHRYNLPAISMCIQRVSMQQIVNVHRIRCISIWERKKREKSVKKGLNRQCNNIEMSPKIKFQCLLYFNNTVKIRVEMTAHDKFLCGSGRKSTETTQRGQRKATNLILWIENCYERRKRVFGTHFSSFWARLLCMISFLGSWLTHPTVIFYFYFYLSFRCFFFCLKPKQISPQKCAFKEKRYIFVDAP